MRGGALRNLLTIRRKVQVGVSKLNEPITVWEDWRVDVPCEVEVRRGREHFANNQRFSEEIWRFRVRYDEVIGLDASMRVSHEGMTFDIKAPLPDGQRRADIIIEATLQDAVIGGKPLAIGILDMINTPYLGDAYEGFKVTASGGQAPYVISVFSGELPTGLTLNPSTGDVAGVPLAAGDFYPTFQVVDAAGDVSRLPEITMTVS